MSKRIIYVLLLVSIISSVTILQNNNIIYKNKDNEVKTQVITNEKIIYKTNPINIENQQKIFELQSHIKELSIQNANYENAVKKLMSVGTRPKNYNMPEIVSRGSFYTYKDKMEYAGEWLCTYYAPNKKECGNDLGITYSGKPVTPGVSAAIDPKYYEFGTKLYVEGLGIYICDDIGSAIKGEKRVDLCTFSTHISNSGSFRARVWIIKD